MGLGPEEEAAVRAASKKHEGKGNHYEEFEALLEGLDDMRPVHEVTIGPLLVSDRPLGKRAVSVLSGPSRKKKASVRKTADKPEVFALAVVADVLERSSFRLLSESEREYLTRGNGPAQLTPIGNEVPTEAALSILSEPGGPFGFSELGTLPEVCADAYVGGYAGAPADGSPRTGKGPLVVRGGAAWVSPWQDCGEWQLLCCAVRSTVGGWDQQSALRLALGIQIRSS